MYLHLCSDLDLTFITTNGGEIFLKGNCVTSDGIQRSFVHHQQSFLETEFTSYKSVSKFYYNKYTRLYLHDLKQLYRLYVQIFDSQVAMFLHSKLQENPE